jgi:hypothetical protein
VRVVVIVANGKQMLRATLYTVQSDTVAYVIHLIKLGRSQNLGVMSYNPSLGIILMTHLCIGLISLVF